MAVTKKDRIEVLLHPGLELLGVLDLLGPAKINGLPDHAYTRELVKAFSPLREHPAVALNAKLSLGDPNGALRKDALMKRSAPPTLRFDGTMSANRGDSERSGELEPWLKALADFARAGQFSRTLARCARHLEPALAELRAAAGTAGHLPALERYTGLDFNGRFYLLASPLCRKGSVLNRVWTRDDGRVDVYSVLEPEGSNAGLTFVDDELDECVWHEGAHAVMDLTVNLYDYEEAATPLDLGPELRQNCRNWLHGMREHLVRAVMLRLIALERGESAAEGHYEREPFSRRPHLKAFVDRLREYESARRTYPTLADFYPRLAEAFPAPASGRSALPVAGEHCGPFDTPGQRAAALRRLDALLRRSNDPRLRARRVALTSA